jgi:hypothetical protein
MIINAVNNEHTPSQTLEPVGNPQTTALVEEVALSPEMPKPKQALPNVFTLQAHSKSTKSKKPEKKTKQPINDPYTREYLERECHLIAAYVVGKYGQGNAGSSALNQALRREITFYMQSIGTPTALQMLKERYPK